LETAETPPRPPSAPPAAAGAGPTRRPARTTSSCLPLFLWLLFGNDDELAAAIVLAELGATDWVREVPAVVGAELDGAPGRLSAVSDHR
jgi:hypothetical protein